MEGDQPVLSSFVAENTDHRLENAERFCSCRETAEGAQRERRGNAKRKLREHRGSTEERRGSAEHAGPERRAFCVCISLTMLQSFCLPGHFIVCLCCSGRSALSLFGTVCVCLVGQTICPNGGYLWPTLLLVHFAIPVDVFGQLFCCSLLFVWCFSCTICCAFVAFDLFWICCSSAGRISQRPS